MTSAAWHGLLLTLVLSLAALAWPQTDSPRPDINALKRGVVRVRNTRFDEVGTGIVVKVNRDEAYIVTSAHVVRGDENPEVYLFTRQKEPLRARLLNREEDGQKGLALLWLKAEGQALAGLTALSLGNSSGLEGGEAVTLLGFPGGTSIWTVTPGTVARHEGREVVFTGPVTTGNSGGPLLLGGRVVGLVTDTNAPFSYAAQAESVAQYIRGIEPELADLSAKPTPTPTPMSSEETTHAPNFCTALTALLDASEDGFDSIKGRRHSELLDFYDHTIYLPGSVSGRGWILLNREAFYILADEKDKGRVEAEFTRVSANVRRCLRTWESKEQHDYFRFLKFREGIRGRAVVITYLDTPDKDGDYYLAINIHALGYDGW